MNEEKVVQKWKNRMCQRLFSWVLRHWTFRSR